MQTTTAGESWDPMRGEVECDECGADIPSGEVVVLDGMVRCQDCGWMAAAHTLAPLLCSAWTRADIESGRREYEDAAAVLAILSARITRRLARGE